MKKKSKEIKNHWRGLSSKIILFIPLLILIFAAFSLSLFLSGCAKTAYPNPPIITPPPLPKVLSAGKLKNSISIIYEYSHSLNGIKGFLIYEKWYKNKKKVKFSCNSSTLIAFQNLLFAKKFSLQYNKFFYNVNKKDLKTGYYIFCVRSEDNFGIKSGFSNYIAVHIVI
ncbi:MAG: hypothetical protein EVJ47_00210 [Candidatus Acidulodesulfobacterium ferriphilum]|uniref:Uncharacterized protein n=1 Tax=Candidatus Acidulodesulfobacterium ferriphilum TaxID=2597223 RepID=A0A519BC10_9DELT|nr:MAG: hypothetical protein EVJ47_00210 [Candidatus Acidulodesulfobacterium ferriphilum]